MRKLVSIPDYIYRELVKFRTDNEPISSVIYRLIIEAQHKQKRG